MKNVLSLLVVAGLFTFIACNSKRAEETIADSLDSAAEVADTTSSTSDTTTIK